jgi:hypothetical protein
VAVCALNATENRIVASANKKSFHNPRELMCFPKA